MKLPFQWRPLTGTWVGALVTVGCALAAYFLPVSYALDQLSFDVSAYLQRGEEPPEVVIIYMDDKSRDLLKQHSDKAWDRRYHARLVDLLRASGARMAVFDVVFDSLAEDPREDQALALAMTGYRRVVIGANLTVREEENSAGDVIKMAKPELPIDTLLSAAAGYGYVNMMTEPDGAVRQHLPVSERFPGLSWTCARLLGAPGAKPSGTARRWLRYYGPPDTFRKHFYAWAIQNLVDPGIQASFRDKVVFIGALQSVGFTGAGKDEFPTVYTRFSKGAKKGYSPGVEIQATAFVNLLRQDWIVQVPQLFQFLSLLLVALFTGGGLTLIRPRRAIWIGASSLVVVPILGWVMHQWVGMWFAWCMFEVVIAVGLMCTVTSNSLRAYVEKQTLALKTHNLELEADNLRLAKEKSELQMKTLEQSIGFHLSPARVRQLIEKPDLLKPGTEQMVVSILFSDIAVYSKVAETLDPEDLVRLLNNYYEAALKCVHDTEGTVLQLVGDAIYAIWNAPVAQADHSDRVCRSALMLADRLDNFGAAQGTMPFRTRIGIHTGLACVGNVGSSTRFDYIAIGQNVNLASRLEGLNKYMGTQILATRDVLKGAGNDILSRRIGYFRFKGFGRLVEIAEVVGTSPNADGAKPWIQAFDNAVNLFRAREFDAATQAFNQVIELRSRIEDPADVSEEFRTRDGPSIFYLKQIEQFRAKSPTAEWVGEIHMDEK